MSLVATPSIEGADEEIEEKSADPIADDLFAQALRLARLRRRPGKPLEF